MNEERCTECGAMTVDVIPCGCGQDLCESCYDAQHQAHAWPCVDAKEDIVSVASRYLRVRKRGNVYVACCPVHGEDTPSLILFPDSQHFRCYGCNTRGDAIILERVLRAALFGDPLPWG